MTERYNPFTGKGTIEPKDTPLKKAKRFLTEDKPFGTRSKLNCISDNVVSRKVS
jgi:hypothetical protein